MGSPREIRTKDLDAAGHGVTGLPTAVNPSDAVPLSQVQGLDAAVLAAALASIPSSQILTVDSIAAGGILLPGLAFPATGQVLCRVLSVRAWFFLDRTSTLTADGITVVTALGGVGRWIRLPIPDPFWATILAWKLNPSGNDENDGSTNPLKTHAELERRTLGAIYSSGARVVDVQGDYSSVAPILNVGTVGVGKAVYTSTPTVLLDRGDGFTGTVTTLVALNKSANQSWTITDTALPASNSFTALVGKFVHFYNSGTNALIGTAMIAKDLGAKTARLSSVTLAADLWSDLGINNPGTIVSGAKYRVIQQFRMPPPVLLQRAATWIYYGLAVPTSASLPIGSPPDIAVNFKLCEFVGNLALSSVNINAYQCSLTGCTGTDVQGGFVDCLARGALWNISGSTVDFFNDMMFQGGGCFLQRVSTSYQSDIALFDSALPALELGQVNTIFMRGLLWGSGNSAEIVNMLNNHNHLALTQAPVATTSGNELAMGGITGSFAALGTQIDSAKQNTLTYSS